MNIQTNKLHLIKWITQLEDENLIEQLMQFQTENDTIPQWQIEETRKRMDEYRKNPSIAMDFDEAMDDIEKQLN